MQNARIKALIITDYCGLSSLIKPETVRRSLCSCVLMDSWQTKGIESYIDMLGATSSVVDGSPARKKKEG
jgi:hypothetical protein